ncbi:MAG: M23 family metallopeptidase [Sphingobacteriales bacterium]|nr:MAG: M23 family metallopeptidase [Sphingobacteriales bacterium]
MLLFKSLVVKTLLFILIISGSYSSMAQDINDNISTEISGNIFQKAQSHYDRIPALQQWMQANNYSSRAAAGHVLFRWPLRVNSNYDDIPGYYMIQNYVDQDWSDGMGKEWYCKFRTYDGHEGIDINLFPLWWRMKDNNNVFAAAAAAGIVIFVENDIVNDNNCAPTNEAGNVVAILHSDSSITRYAHLKTGTARVTEGQFVQEGQLLAFIGSSGRSSNPHLHFDVRDKNNSWIEPNSSSKGFCNIRNIDSWWINQKQYWEPAVLRVMTHSGTPYMQGWINDEYKVGFCPEVEDDKAQNHFDVNASITVGIALRDVHPSDSVFVTIHAPNGSVVRSYKQAMSNSGLSDRYSRSYRTNRFLLPNDNVVGTYTINVLYRHLIFDENVSPGAFATKAYNHYFTVGCKPDETLSGNLLGSTGYITANSIKATQNILGGKVMYQSAGYIQLNPGFKATEGTVFKARIRDCNFSE